MMLKVVLLAALVVIAAARTVEFEQENDVGFQGFFDGFLQDFDLNDAQCNKALKRCQLCITRNNTKGCIDARLVTKGDIRLSFSINNVVLIEGDVTSSNPAPICRAQTGTQLCILATKVDLNKLSACVDVSYENRGTRSIVHIGCFAIPQAVQTSVLGDLFELNLEGAHCEKGKCQMCIAKEGHKGCIIATSAGKEQIHLQLTVDGKPVLKGDITTTSPAPFCAEHVLGADKICMVPTKVDLKKLSACVSVSIRVRGISRAFSVGCFTIPPKDQLLDSDLLQAFHVTMPGDASCTKGQCKLCIKDQSQEGCVVATAAAKGPIKLELTLNSVTIFGGEISTATQDPICTSSIPGQPMVQKMCMIPKDIDLDKLHACIDLSITVQGMTQSMPMGCFTIPTQEQLLLPF